MRTGRSPERALVDSLIEEGMSPEGIIREVEWAGTNREDEMVFVVNSDDVKKIVEYAKPKRAYWKYWHHQSTVPYEPVEHEWGWNCSECDFDPESVFGIIDEDYQISEYCNYCPSCGSLMDVIDNPYLKNEKPEKPFIVRLEKEYEDGDDIGLVFEI